MFCPKCGNVLTGNEEFCPQCGQPLNTIMNQTSFMPEEKSGVVKK